MQRRRHRPDHVVADEAASTKTVRPNTRGERRWRAMRLFAPGPGRPPGPPALASAVHSARWPSILDESRRLPSGRAPAPSPPPWPRRSVCAVGSRVRASADPSWRRLSSRRASSWRRPPRRRPLRDLGLFGRPSAAKFLGRRLPCPASSACHRGSSDARWRRRGSAAVPLMISSSQSIFSAALLVDQRR